MHAANRGIPASDRSVALELAETCKEVSELARFFPDVRGTFVLFDREADTTFVWNEARAKELFVPASTFKVANSLIGLDVGAAKAWTKSCLTAANRNAFLKHGSGT